MELKPIEIITSNTKYPAPFTHRVLILCEEKNISYCLTLIDTENKPDWFLKIAPLGLVPVLRIDEDVLEDSHAICEYLDALSLPFLLPTDSNAFEAHQNAMNFADRLAEEIALLVKQGNIPHANFEKLNALLLKLNQTIQYPYYFGKQLSLVDIYLISHLLWIDSLEQKNFINPLIKNFPAVEKWLINIKERPAVKKTMGDDYTSHFVTLLKTYHLL